MKFGKLTVINRIGSNKHHTALWLCKCECGTEKIIPSGPLLKGESNSCGCLKSKGEWQIAELLSKNNIPFEKEKIFDDCVLLSGNRARFDFYVDNKYIIEFDGIQHFNITSGWNNESRFQQTQINDKIKNDWCKKHNVPIIRIPYLVKDVKLEDLLLETSKYII